MTTTTDDLDVTAAALEATEPDEGDSTADLAFVIKKFHLLALLEQAASVLPTRDVMPVLKNFQVEVDAVAGTITVVSTDLTLSVVSTTSLVTVVRSGTAVFPGRKLLDIVKEADDGELTVDVKSGTAHLSIGRAQWTLKLMNGDDYPDLPDTTETEWKTWDRVKFLGALRAVSKAASSETTRPSLMLIDIQGGRVRAADGVRFQQIDLGEKFADIDIQIPIDAVDDLQRLLRSTEADNFQLGEDDNFLVFKIDANVFIAQKASAIFPDVDEGLLKPALANDQDLQVDRSELVSAIKRVRINADPETSAVVLALIKSKLTVQAKDKYGNDSAETLDVKWEHPDREVAFNHVHLLEMLEMADVKSCYFLLGEDTKTRRSSLLLKDEETGQMGVLNQLRKDFVS